MSEQLPQRQLSDEHVSMTVFGPNKLDYIKQAIEYESEDGQKFWVIDREYPGLPESNSHRLEIAYPSIQEPADVLAQAVTIPRYLPRAAGHSEAVGNYADGIMANVETLDYRGDSVLLSGRAALKFIENNPSLVHSWTLRVENHEGKYLDMSWYRPLLDEPALITLSVPGAVLDPASEELFQATATPEVAALSRVAFHPDPQAPQALAGTV